ncbi:MAG TPA: imidazoleglycerol-phosphate dehydratase HisB [Clostridiaceae bacterium]|nr:imidazoleglycerol-phosphate dehydratase HisB [Clostridiaceae bacterium]
MERSAQVSRKTNETDVWVKLDIDGSGKCEVDTGIGFFNHMLSLFARHGLFDVNIRATGDLCVDAHHTVEDVGITLGQTLKEALGSKSNIKRYGTSFVPMDETLAMVVVDLSGRPFLVFDAKFTADRIGEMDTELVEEFFRALAYNAGITLHIKVFYGSNNHHIAEAIFKAFGRALDEATNIDGRIEGVMSTKGIL